jgi:hypothetical protein
MIRRVCEAAAKRFLAEYTSISWIDIVVLLYRSDRNLWAVLKALGRVGRLHALGKVYLGRLLWLKG